MEPSPILQVDEQEQILDYVYSNFDTEENFGLSAKQLQIIHENIQGTPLSLRQIEAAMEYVCACGILCDKEEMLDVLKEMDRRFVILSIHFFNPYSTNPTKLSNKMFNFKHVKEIGLFLFRKLNMDFFTMGVFIDVEKPV